MAVNPGAQVAGGNIRHLRTGKRFGGKGRNPGGVETNSDREPKVARPPRNPVRTGLEGVQCPAPGRISRSNFERRDV